MSKIFYNGPILNAEKEEEQAAAVLIEKGRIAKVYKKGKPIPELKDPAVEKRDLQGKTLIPGFVDGHSHFLQVARLSSKLNARTFPFGKAHNAEELVSWLREQSKEPPFDERPLLEAEGYDESGYPDHRIPTREDLDQVTDRPLVVRHVSGHNAVFNTAALQAAGIRNDYVPTSDGEAGRFPNGRLNGIFYESAVSDVMRGLQHLERSGEDPLEEDRRIFREGLPKALRTYAGVGVTTAQDGGTSPLWYREAQEAADEGLLSIDLVSYVLGDGYEAVIPDHSGSSPADVVYRNGYRVAGRKLFLDGSPQAKTAWLSKPYITTLAGHGADYRGYGRVSDDDLLEYIREAFRHHWQINVHTNGDEAIEQLIRVYGKVKKETGDPTDLRPVSIHCQTVREDQLDRIRDLGMYASFFVDHVYYWGDYHVSDILGKERAERISPLKSALSRGIPFSLHQDTPVTPQNPIFAIHNAVNRRTRVTGTVLGEEYRITPWEALRSVTYGSARQIFEEQEKGTIEEGKRADLAILSDNLLTVPEEKIRDVKVLETIKDGRTIYSSEE